MLGAFLEILLILFIVNILFYYMRSDLIAATASQFNTDTPWKATVLAIFQSTHDPDSLGIYLLLWFVSGLIFGIRHKDFKSSITVGIITPLAECQMYILMLQQYTPDLWNSYSAQMQDQIIYSTFFAGLELCGYLLAGLLLTTAITVIRERSKSKVEIVIPEEKLKPFAIVCSNCGKTHYSNAKYCSSCGEPLPIPVEPTEQQTMSEEGVLNEA